MSNKQCQVSSVRQTSEWIIRGPEFNPQLCLIYFALAYIDLYCQPCQHRITRMHSSRMRTARSLTVSHSICRGAYLPGVPAWGGLYLAEVCTCQGGVPAQDWYLPGGCTSPWGYLAVGEGCTCQGGVPAQGEQISTCEGLDQDHCGRGEWTWALYRWSGVGLGEGGRALQRSSLPPPPVNRITENITFPQLVWSRVKIQLRKSA